jgi:hypothetical protein
VLGTGTRERKPWGPASKIAASVLLPAVTGVVINVASSNARNPWAWGALGLLLATHASVLLVGTSRWRRVALAAGVAAVVAVTVTIGLVLVPPPREETPAACPKVDPAKFIAAPVKDPGLGVTWEVGYACENARALVFAEPSDSSRQVGVLYQGQPLSVFLCWVERGGEHWYRTAADEKRADNGWGYVSATYVRAAHPISGMVSCPG